MDRGPVEFPWLRWYPAGVPWTITSSLDQWRSVGELLEDHARRYAGRAAFSFFGTPMSFARTQRLARCFAAYLQSIGIAKGDRVAIMMPNCLQYPVVMLGTLLAGAVVVNVNPLYTPRELGHQLRDSGAAAVVTIDLTAPAMAEALPGTDVRHVVATSLGDLVGGIKGLFVSQAARRRRRVPATHRSIPGAVSWGRALRRGARARLEAPSIEPDDIAFLQYTGGTTGVAKGAMLTHRNIIANVLQSKAWLTQAVENAQPVSLALLPMYHVFSLTMNALTFFVSGGESVLIADPRDVDAILRALKGRAFDAMCGTNTLFVNLLESRAFCARDFSRLRLVVSGGMKLQRATAERWLETIGVPITEGYGLTEASPVLTANPVDLATGRRAAFSGSVGLPVPSTEVGLRRGDGSWAEAGEAGEICARGPQVMRGYWRQPEETARVLDAQGWLSTGDVGIMDERGFVRIVDRIKDVIIVSGFNVYPTEIEEVVSRHPGVQECAAVGIADDVAGERVRLIVVARDASVTRGDIVAHCRAHLTGYKIPTLIEFTQAPLPRSTVGKLLRRALPAPMAAPLETIAEREAANGDRRRSLVG